MNKSTITLTLNDTVIIMGTHDVDGKQLYKAQDLLKGYGMEGKQVSNTISHWKISMESKLLDFRVLSIKGKNGGTYLTQRNLLKLAGYVSYEFEDAVYEAFENLVNGNVEAAKAVAKSVVEVVHEATLMTKPRHRIRTFLSEFDNIDEGVNSWILGMHNNPKATYEDRVRTLKSLTAAVNESYDSISAREYLKAISHEAALKLIATEERFQARNNLSYSH